MNRLTVCTWKWGDTFAPHYVNTLRAMLERHLHLDHELVCVTDNGAGLDGDIRVVPMPTTYANTPRCRRRMQVFDREFGGAIGDRILLIDLDVVIVGDLTPIVNRPEPHVGWRVRHAQVFSGSFVLFDAGALHDAWVPYRDDPEGYPTHVQPKGVPSDQAMVNFYLRTQPPIPCWTEADGFVTYFGEGYEALEHFGVGPRRQRLPAGARIVVLGSADKAVLEGRRYRWVERHWK